MPLWSLQLGHKPVEKTAAALTQEGAKVPILLTSKMRRPTLPFRPPMWGCCRGGCLRLKGYGKEARVLEAGSTWSKEGKAGPDRGLPPPPTPCPCFKITPAVTVWRTGSRTRFWAGC